MTIGQGEYKSQVGLDKVYYALVSKDDATGYTAAAPVWLAPAGTAKVSTTRNQNMQYADDGVFDTSEGEGESKIDIEVTNVPLSVAAVLLGRTYNATNGMLIDGSAANPPDCALLFRSKKSNGKYKYLCYLKGKFSLADEDYATLEGQPSPKMVKLTYTAVRTIFEFTTATGVKETVKKVEADADISASASLINGWYTAVPVPVAPSP
ncbi:MAG: major tail protein [Anaerolineaceae bacterium]|jgi:phi13 family phage major tail protein